MHKIFIAFVSLFVILTFSCDSPNKSHENKSITVYDYLADSLIFKRPYKLSIVDKDSFLVYRYVTPEIDSKKVRNITFRYTKSDKLITMGPFQFEMVKVNAFQNENLGNIPFDLYELNESVMDGNGPMLFNVEYGALNIDKFDQLIFIPSEIHNDSLVIYSVLDFLKKNSISKIKLRIIRLSPD
jgi:hypothetical protein